MVTGEPPKTVPVPRSAADITTAWMSEALGTDVTDVTIRETIGGTATKILLDVDYASASELPKSMCLKGGLGDHAAFMAQVCIYATEALFFRDERSLIAFTWPTECSRG